MTHPADGAPAPNPLLGDGALEALKWLALLLMTGDHVNKYLMDGLSVSLNAAGRIAMPLFLFVLACNLARPGFRRPGAHRRVLHRLALFGTLATAPYLALGGGLPLNILFTLFTFTAVISLVEQRTPEAAGAALAAFAVGGALTEFGWAALTLGLALWWLCRAPGRVPLALALIALGNLYLVNDNLWALAAAPVALAAAYFDPPIPRLRWVFYAFYPLHLALLWLARELMIANDLYLI